MIVLAGDVGGTNARLATVEVGDRQVRIVREERYPSRDFSGLAPIVHRFLEATGGRPERACFGLAGPVVDQRCRTSNLPWTLDARALAYDIGIPHTFLINDFDAIGYGVERLGGDDLVTLQEGAPQPHGPIAIIGAGTGLGQGFLVWDGSGYTVHSSEGGHVAFAPRNALEWGLVESLRAEHGHVSYERVLSGTGLAYLYRYLVARGPEPERPATRAELERDDPAAVVTRHALAGTDPACVRALDLFVSVYGSQAGQFALTVLATGGAYVAGGIAPRIVEKLRDGTFIAAFRDQGRLSALAAAVPVHVIMNPNVGLLGAAAAAFRQRLLDGGHQP